MADDRTYIKVHDGMPEHPKVVGLSDKAFRTLMEAWCYSSRNHTDGDMTTAAWERVGTRKARAELVKVGLAEPTTHGVHMHDYLEHQRSAAQIQEVRERRRASGKRGGEAKAKRLASAKQDAKQTPSKIVAVSEVPNGTQTEVPKITSSGASTNGRDSAAPVVAAYIEASQDAGRGRPTSALVNKVGKDAKRLLEVDRVPLERIVAAARHVGAGGWANLDVGVQQTAEVRRDLQEWIEP